jgi:hypothetical protein
MTPGIDPATFLLVAQSTVQQTGHLSVLNHSTHQHFTCEWESWQRQELSDELVQLYGTFHKTSVYRNPQIQCSIKLQQAIKQHGTLLTVYEVSIENILKLNAQQTAAHNTVT